jgi:tRNA (adenine-N(1)-)-methyltransferase non-catalytic subunit
MSSNTSTTILPGHHVLLRLASGLVKSVQIEKDGNVTAGRIGTFSANALLHHPYGLTYEVSGRDLVILPPRTMQEVGEKH